MFRKLLIAVITAWAALLETVADAIAATLPPPAAGSPRLRVVATGRLCLRLLIVSPPPCRPRHTAPYRVLPNPGRPARARPGGAAGKRGTRFTCLASPARGPVNGCRSPAGRDSVAASPACSGPACGR